jgi:hypothetical protein
MEVTARVSINIITAQQGSAYSLNDSQRKLIETLIDGATDYIEHDDALGWSIRKGGKAKAYEANRFGVRSSREYDYQRIPVGVHRIAAFGDSYTHSDNVANQDAWPARIESLNPRYEALNFGVPGYGLDQAYLRFLRNQDKFTANTVMFGMLSENVYRHINTFKPFYHRASSLPLGKPRFILTGMGLEKVPNWFVPVDKYRELLADQDKVIPVLGQNDYYYNHRLQAADCRLLYVPCALSQVNWLIREKTDRWQKNEYSALLQYDIHAEGPAVTLAIIQAFADAIIGKGMRPVFVVFPYKADYVQFRITGKTTYAPILNGAAAMGIPAWDAMDAFRVNGKVAYDYEQLFDGHYTAKANQLIASWVLANLERLKTSGHL